MKYFKLNEFDSPDSKGSGKNMTRDFLKKLDRARYIANVPFKISSGFRTPQHNVNLREQGYKASANSSHLKGLAVDIGYNGSRERYLIVQSLMHVGINRIGIGKTFIHCDVDNLKDPDVIWLY